MSLPGGCASRSSLCAVSREIPAARDIPAIVKPAARPRTRQCPQDLALALELELCGLAQARL